MVNVRSVVFFFLIGGRADGRYMMHGPVRVNIFYISPYCLLSVLQNFPSEKKIKNYEQRIHLDTFT